MSWARRTTRRSRHVDRALARGRTLHGPRRPLRRGLGVSMRVQVLGSAAGGGFPQWNCACPNCRGARQGLVRYRPRTQSAIALSADDRRWFLFNASPDLRTQLAAAPRLWPQGAVRQTPIQAVVLTDAELDHTLGLLALREGRYVRLYATAWVHRAISEWNPLLRVLGAFCDVEWQPVRLGEPTPLCGSDGMESGLRLEAFSTLATKTVAYASQAAGPVAPEASVGYRITEAHTNHALVYLPALQTWTATIQEQLVDCSALLVDGTCWDDDELARLGIAGKTARAMGHLPIGGTDGSLERVAALDARRKVYIHLNNTNPLLDEDAPQRRLVASRGIEVAYDGMELMV
jgi:pyrroloquinoline quinone biosynthesis protein B